MVGSARPVVWEFQGGARVSIAGRVRVDSFTLARTLGARGVGVVRTARMFAAPLVARGELIPVLERHWPQTAVHAVHAGPFPAVPKVRAFIELARVAVARALR